MSDLIEEGKQLKEVWPLVQRTYHLSLSQIVLNSHADPKVLQNMAFLFYNFLKM